MDRTWHTVGTQLTQASESPFPHLQNGKNNPCFPVGKEGPHEKIGKEGIPWVQGHWAGTQQDGEAGVKRTSHANPECPQVAAQLPSAHLPGPRSPPPGCSR